VKSILIIFFDITGTVDKEFVLAGQRVNSAYYCHVLRRQRKNVQRLRLELWRQKDWLLHHDNAQPQIYFFTGGVFFFTKITRLESPINHIFLFPRLKIKLNGSHFDTIEVIETESQAVLNTLRAHGFQDAFKQNGIRSGNGVYPQKGTELS
jgi:hypothetical protein